MKRFLFAILFMFCFFATLIAPTAYAEENTEEQLEESVYDQLDELDLSELEQFANEYDIDGISGIKQTIERIIGGEFGGLSSESVSDFFKSVLNDFFGFLPALISVIVICLLGGILRSGKSNFLNNSTGEVVHFVCYIAILLIILGYTFEMLNKSKSAVYGLQNLMNISFPILLSFISIAGGTTTISVCSPLMSILSNLIIIVIGSVIFPLFLAVIVLSVVGNLSANVNLNKLKSSVQSISGWLLGIMFGLFTAVLTGYGLIGTSIDGLSVKAAKFALSGYVPIIGGYLSSGFDVVLAGSLLIKNSLGAVLLIIMFSLIVLPALKILLFSLALKLTAGIVSTVSDARETELLSSLSSALKLLVAVLLGLGFLFFIVVILVISAGNAGVM